MTKYELEVEDSSEYELSIDLCLLWFFGKTVVFSTGMTVSLSQDHNHRPRSHLWFDFVYKIRIIIVAFLHVTSNIKAILFGSGVRRRISMNLQEQCLQRLSVKIDSTEPNGIPTLLLIFLVLIL